MLRHLWDRF